MQRYSAEKAAWRIRRPLFRAFFLSLNRAHSPRPVLNGARPWNRVRGHSSCLPRFIPAFGRRAVLLFSPPTLLRGIEPTIITRHHFCSDYLRCLANRHGNRSRIESVGRSVRKDDRGKKIRFGREWDEEGWASRRFRFRVGHAREAKKLVSISYFDAIKLATFLASFLIS